MPVQSTGGMPQIPEFHIAQPEGKVKGFQFGKNRNIALVSGDSVKNVSGKVLGQHEKLGMIDKMNYVVLPLTNDKGKLSRVALHISDSAEVLFGSDNAIKNDQVKKQAKNTYKTAANELREITKELGKKSVTETKLQQKFEKILGKIEDKFGDKDINDLIDGKDIDLTKFPADQRRSAEELKHLGVELKKAARESQAAQEKYNKACAVLQDQIGAVVQNRLESPKAETTRAEKKPLGDKAVTSLATKPRPPTTPRPKEQPIEQSGVEANAPKQGPRDLSTKQAVEEAMNSILRRVYGKGDARRGDRMTELRLLSKNKSASEDVRTQAANLLAEHEWITENISNQERILKDELKKPWDANQDKVRAELEKLENILSEGIARVRAAQIPDPVAMKEILNEATEKGTGFIGKVAKEEAKDLASAGPDATPAEVNKAYTTLTNVLNRMPGSKAILNQLQKAKNLSPKEKALAITTALIAVTGGLYYIGSRLGISSDDFFSNKFVDTLRQNAENSLVGFKYLYRSLPSLRGATVPEDMAAAIENASLHEEQSGEALAVAGGIIWDNLKNVVGGASNQALLAATSLSQMLPSSLPDVRGGFQKVADFVSSATFGSPVPDADDGLEAPSKQVGSAVGEEFLDVSRHFGHGVFDPSIAQDALNSIPKFQERLQVVLKTPGAIANAIHERMPNLHGEELDGAVGQVQKLARELASSNSDKVTEFLASATDVTGPGAWVTALVVALGANAFVGVGKKSRYPMEASADDITKRLTEKLAGLNARRESFKNMLGQQAKSKAEGRDTPAIDNIVQKDKVFFDFVDRYTQEIETAMNKKDIAKAQRFLEDFENFVKGKPKAQEEKEALSAGGAGSKLKMGDQAQTEQRIEELQRQIRSYGGKVPTNKVALKSYNKLTQELSRLRKKLSP